MPAPPVSQIVMDANTVTAIINNINSLYSNAIGQLITFTIGILAFVGILLPAIVSFLQSRQLKADHKTLSDKISLETQMTKAALIEELKSTLADELTSFEKKVSEIKDELNMSILKSTARANAKAHHLQATTSMASGDYIGVFKDCVTAITDYAVAEDEANMQIVLKAILIPSVLPNLKKLILKVMKS